MSNNYRKTTSGLADLLLVTFIVLKLCGVIDWNWWWVLSPLWIPLLIVLVAYVAIWFLGGD